MRGAWDDWLKSSEYGKSRFTRTRACVVQERIIDRAFRVFPSSIKPIEKNNTVSFIKDNQVLFRFKKADPKYFTHNVQTNLALAFHNHQKSFPEFGEIDFARVEVVYVLDKTETEIQQGVQ